MRRSARGGGWLAGLALALALLLMTPLLAVLASVFQSGGEAWDHLAATVLPGYITNTLVLAILVGIGTLVIGTGTAWLVTLCRFPGQRIFRWALVLPLTVPTYVVAYAYTDFLQHSGPVQTLLRDLTGWGPRDYWFPDIRSLPGAALAFTFVLYPYVYMLARAAFLQQSGAAFEVARSLGRGPSTAFLRIALPMARPALAVGAALALMETLADYGAVAHFGVRTFTTGIYRAWFSMGDRVAATQLAACLVAFVLLLLALERWQRRGTRVHGRAQERVTAPLHLSGWRGWSATLACALPLAIGFLAPAAILLGLAWPRVSVLAQPRYVDLVVNSFTLAGSAALATVLVALLLAYAARLRPSAATRAAVRLASLGYALPGSIVAVGILWPLAGLDNRLDAFMRSSFGVSTGLLLTGSIAALLFGYAVRFMAVALGTLEASLAKVTPSMDDVSRTLGRGPLVTLLRVHAPIIRGGLLTAALLVFVEVMKELPATLIMRPFNFDTLAVQAHRLASDERLAEAAVPSLVIVAVGLLPVIALSREIARPSRRASN